MICNKCGSPIMPGEDVCHNCEIVEEKSNNDTTAIEIIDLVEPEVIDFTAGFDDVVMNNVQNSVPTNSNNGVSQNVNSAASAGPVVLPAVPVPPAPPVQPSVQAPVQPAPVSNPVPSEPVPVATPITEAPLEATGVMKKVELPVEDNVNDESLNKEVMSSNETQSVVSESTPYVVTSPDEKNKTEIEEVIAPQTEEKIEKKEKEKKGSSHILGKILIAILLIASIGLNVYLLITNSEEKIEEEVPVGISATRQTIYLNKYKLEAPSNWTVATQEDSNQIILMDSTENWAVSVNVKEGLDSAQISTSVDKITETFGKSKYLFTSDYVADISSNDYYVFKGKYYNYITYVVTRAVNTSTVAMADLKFKGEVNEEIYTEVISVLKTISKLDIEEIYSNNFDFNDISEILAKDIKINASEN